MNAVEYVKIYDEATPQRDGTVVRNKVATFYIGKHGPFTERMPNDENWKMELDRRISTLSMHLGSLTS